MMSVMASLCLKSPARNYGVKLTAWTATAAVLVAAIACRDRGTAEGRVLALGKDTTWCRYQPGTVASIQDSVRGYRLPPGFHVAEDQFPTLALVRFGGLARATEPQVRHFGNMFDLQVRHLPDSLDLLQRELNFVEAQDTIWLPVEESLIREFSAEVASGDTVTVFVAYLGTIAFDDSTQQRVLVVSEFESHMPGKRWIHDACASPTQLGT